MGRNLYCDLEATFVVNTLFVLKLTLKKSDQSFKFAEHKQIKNRKKNELLILLLLL